MTLALIIIATILYSVFAILLNRAAGRIDATVGTVVYLCASGVAALAIWLVQGFGKKTPTTSSGLAYSVLAGVTVAVFSILLLKVFARSPVSYVMPIIYGGVVVLTALAGWLLFKERISGIQAAGLLLIVFGIGLVIFSRLKTA